MIIDWKQDLFKEKSLQSAFFKSRKLRRSPFNDSLFGLLGSLPIAFATYWFYIGDVEGSAQATRNLSDITFNLTVQLLGFLIGGFAIFSSFSAPSVMKKLAQSPMRDGVSVFKVIYFNFLSVFYIYVITLSVSIGIKFFGMTNLVPTKMMAVNNILWVVNFVNCAAFIAISFLLISCIIRLKSFIWNIYQCVITMLAISDESN